MKAANSHMKRQRSFVVVDSGRARKRRRQVRRRPTRRFAKVTGVELKFYDTFLVNDSLTAPADATGAEHDPSATILLNTVVQGDGESNRDGRQIIMKKISLRGVIKSQRQADQIAADNAPFFYLALVLDTQTNGATISSENVFLNPGANAILASSPFRNLRFIKRFQVLKTLVIKGEQLEMAFDGTNLEQNGVIIPWEMHANLGNLEVNYSGTSETVTSITDNSLHLIAYANDIDQIPTISYNCRLRFVD